MKKWIVILLMVTLVGCGQVNEVNDSEVVENNEVNVQEEVEVDVVGALTDDLIEIDYPMSIIEKLSSEKYEGRQAGTVENEMAEDFLVEEFKKFGLLSPNDLDYKQTYTQKAVIPKKSTEITFEGSDLEMIYQVDFTERFFGSYTNTDADVVTEMYVVESLEQLKADSDTLAGKVLLVDSKAITSLGFSNIFEVVDNLGVNISGIIIDSDSGDSKQRIARGLYVEDYIEENDPVYFTVNHDKFVEMTKLANEGVKIKISMDFDVIDAEVANVVGYIKGKHETGENETLILGAHMDHLGDNLDGTYNAGALDNASGVAVVLELARILSEGEQPEDDIIFVLFNGEEDGLLGSEFFVDNTPISYDIKHTRMLNLDMVGSVNEVPLLLSKMDKNLAMQKALIEACKAKDVSYKISSFGGSDHVNFSNQGVESVMLIHYDEAYYHTPLDTYENAISESRLHDVIKVALMFVNQEVYN